MIAINAGAHGDGAALGDGVAGVEQQVHVDLVQFRRQALHQRQLAELAHQGDLVLELVPDDVDGRFQARVQVDQLPRLIATGIREVLQVAHDAGHPLDALARLGHQLRQVAADEVDVEAVTDIVDLRNQRLRVRRTQGALVGLDHGEQAAQVLLQAAQVGVHITDRVVDLVRHTRGELDDRGHLLRLQLLVLGGARVRSLPALRCGGTGPGSALRRPGRGGTVHAGAAAAAMRRPRRWPAGSARPDWPGPPARPR
ncbi:hypothetical protein G6F57_017180 [Rhizopus arrhizus]|nr:hypothetical protein G6F57_017180 [Rhizopus arrhizus]